MLVADSINIGTTGHPPVLNYHSRFRSPHSPLRLVGGWTVGGGGGGVVVMVGGVVG